MRALHRPAAHAAYSSPSRNPLVVQFWLLGVDAAQGHLLSRGFRKAPSAQGSSLYTLNGLTLHSRGLWLDLPHGRVKYLRPSESFHHLPEGYELLNSESRALADVEHLSRAQGLELALPHLLEHEVWMVQQHGPGVRSVPLSRRLPARVRRLVPAWEAWLSGRHAAAWTPPQMHVSVCPPFRLVGAPS